MWVLPWTMAWHPRTLVHLISDRTPITDVLNRHLHWNKWRMTFPLSFERDTSNSQIFSGADRFPIKRPPKWQSNINSFIGAAGTDGEGKHETQPAAVSFLPCIGSLMKPLHSLSCVTAVHQEVAQLHVLLHMFMLHSFYKARKRPFAFYIKAWNAMMFSLWVHRKESYQLLPRGHQWISPHYLQVSRQDTPCSKR